MQCSGCAGMHIWIQSAHSQNAGAYWQAVASRCYEDWGPELRMRCRYAEDRMGWVISHVWHLAGQDIEKTCGEICQKVRSLLLSVSHPCKPLADPASRCLAFMIVISRFQAMRGGLSNVLMHAAAP